MVDKLNASMNKIKTIFPYRSNGLWKLNEYDDEEYDLKDIGFSEDDIESLSFSSAIDKILGHIGIKADKIKITFSINNKFPGHDVKFHYLMKDPFDDGQFYTTYDDNFDFELVLCPSILAWFGIDGYDDVEKIYMKFEEYK